MQCRTFTAILAILTFLGPMAGGGGDVVAQASGPAGPPHSLVFHSQMDNPGGAQEIYQLSPDGTTERVTVNEADDIRPDLSPDGRFIAFASNRKKMNPGDDEETNPEGDYEIFIMSVDGTVLQQVTHNTGTDTWPRWSPSGRQLAFSAQLSATNWEIYIFTLGNLSPVRVTFNDVLDQFPEWSPNGKQLAIHRDFDLYLIDADGANPLQLTNPIESPDRDQMASFSPNGERLAWMSLRRGYTSVFTLDLANPAIQVELTPKPPEIPNSQWGSRSPAWSRDGRHIYFTSRRPGSLGEDIYVMNADGSGVTPLVIAPGSDADAAVR